ncbi:MAG: hypothetical protein WC442_03225 [Candidatus Omnitrophota bacterium]
MVQKNNRTVILNEKKQHLISAIKIEVRKSVLKSVRKWCCFSLTFISVIGFIGYEISLRKIYNNVTENSSQFISDAIKNKFAEPNIENTFMLVAKNEAQEMIKNVIMPEIENFKIDVKKELLGITSFSSDTKTKISNELESIASEVAFLKQRNNLTRLADKAIAEGEKANLDELYKVVGDVSNTELSKAAISEILRVKNYYATMTRVKGVMDKDLTYRGPLGVVHTYEEVSSSTLIKDLTKNANWVIRVKAAEKLRNYKEKNVVNALLKSICHDSNLEVIKTSLESFEAITGYVSHDVFNCNPVQEWWKLNKENIEGKLK